MRKDNGSAKSRALLLTAVIALLDAGSDADRITITDVVSTAGLTRPTFYAVFDDLPAAFAAAARMRLDAAFADLSIDPEIDVTERSERMQSAFTAILQRLAEHADFFSRILRGAGGPIVTAQIIDFIAARIRNASPVSRALSASSVPVDMSSGALAAGVVWTMTQWLQLDVRPPVAEIATQLHEFVESTVFGGLASATDTNPNGELP